MRRAVLFPEWSGLQPESMTLPAAHHITASMSAEVKLVTTHKAKPSLCTHKTEAAAFEAYRKLS